MTKRWLATMCLCAVMLNGCTIPYLAYIRNKSARPALIEVELLDKSRMRTLPNSVLLAGKIVVFRAGFRQNFYNRQTVHWIDTARFSFAVPPGTTIDLTDLAGRFSNGHPIENVRVTVNTARRTDTLLNGRDDFRYQLFQFKNVGISLPLYYYDINQ
jgi:hypothetical protein